MLIQSVAILVSLCMVGMTVVPSALIPCCCKSSECSVLRIDSRGTCCSTPADRPAQASAQRRSCCAPEAVKTASCCPEQSLKPDCPNCRCLEKMQVVALSGYSVYESTGKTYPAALNLAVANPLSMVQETNVRLTETSPPGMHPLSVTCSLRC